MKFTRRNFLGAATMGIGASALAGCASLGEPGAPGWQAGYANAPAGGFAPAPMRLTHGRLPVGFAGNMYRNGPGWFRYGDAVQGHWFDGDGMIQRIHFADGGATHTGQFVATHKRTAEQAEGRFLAAGFGTAGDPDFPVTSSDDVNAANTSVLMVGGELLALWEAGSATRLDPETLETRGLKAWSPELSGMPFLAHPKRDPEGQVWNLAVSGTQVGIYQISPVGELEAFEIVDMGMPSYIHDWAMTDRHLIIFVQPWIYGSFQLPIAAGMEWHPEQGLRMLVLDKDDWSSQRWAEVPAHMFYHTGAAWEDSAGALNIDIALYDRPALGAGAATNMMQGDYISGVDDPEAILARIIVPASGEAIVESTGIEGEFPTVHPQFHGLGRQYTALVGGKIAGRPGAHKLSLIDWASGEAAHYDYGPDHIVEEHIFVAKPGGMGERDAWLVGTSLNIATQRTETNIFDIADISAGPVTRFEAVYSWPLGFHGTFAPT